MYFGGYDMDYIDTKYPEILFDVPRDFSVSGTQRMLQITFYKPIPAAGYDLEFTLQVWDNPVTFQTETNYSDPHQIIVPGSPIGPPYYNPQVLATRIPGPIPVPGSLFSIHTLSEVISGTAVGIWAFYRVEIYEWKLV